MIHTAPAEKLTAMLPVGRRRVPVADDARLWETVIRTLQATEYFAEMPAAAFEALLRSGSVVTVRAGETLIREGSRDVDAIYFLLGGSLDIISGGKYILTLSGVGEMIGEVGAVGRSARTADVVCTADSVLVEISRRTVRALRESRPAEFIHFVELMNAYLGRKLTQTTRRLHGYEDLVLQSQQFQTRSAEMEQEVEDKLRQIVLFSHVIGGSRDGILIAQPDGRLVSLNDAARGYLPDADHAGETPSLFELLPALQRKRAHILTHDFAGLREEWELPDGSGELLPVEATLTPVSQQAETIALALVLRDIREQKRLLGSLEQSRAELERYSHQLEARVAERTRELRQSHGELQSAYERLQAETGEKGEALRRLQETQTVVLQAETMAALGKLAAGVAHEINNPMGFINSNLATLEEYFRELAAVVRLHEALARAVAEDGGRADGERLRAEVSQRKQQGDLAFILDDVPGLLAESREGARRVTDIVQNLKEFTHLDDTERKAMDLNAGLENGLRLIHNEIKYKATVEKAYGDIPPIVCLPREVNQVFLNLLVNAAQAIEREGTIRIATEREGDWAVVTIADTGCGITPDNLARIFEPFYTTKAVGQGTGLGLTVAYNIVKKHGGRIDVESEPERGTRFRVRLPLRPPTSESSQDSS